MSTIDKIRRRVNKAHRRQGKQIADQQLLDYLFPPVEDKTPDEDDDYLFGPDDILWGIYDPHDDDFRNDPHDDDFLLDDEQNPAYQEPDYSEEYWYWDDIDTNFSRAI